MNSNDSWCKEEILALTHLPSLKPSLIRKILNNCQNLNSLLSKPVLPEISFELNQVNLFGSSFKDELDLAFQLAEKEARECIGKDYKIVSLFDESYPELLKSIDYPPIILYVWGDLQKSDSASISIVGTRKNTNYGKFITENFADTFVRNNIIVTSGLAYGVDSIAHQTVVKAKGVTYAVIASGLDRIAPELALMLAKQIVDTGGAIISEYKCSTTANPGFFSQRNRIISGISKATLVVESAEKGGALITARFAFNQQRDVYAVPGNINSERSKGTNKLIKDNIAAIAISPEDMLDSLGLLESRLILSEERKEKLNLSENETKIFEVINHEPMQIDKIAELTALEITEVLVILLELEFKNLVRQLPGKHYIKSNL